MASHTIIEKVGVHQFDCLGLQVRCKVFAPSAAEIIYHPHSCIALDERIHERGPDERGASRNQRPRILPIHLWLLCRFVIEPPAHKNNLALRGSVANLCFCRRSRRDKASCSRIQRGTDFFDQKASRRRIALLPALTKYEPRCSSRKSEQRSETNQSYRPGEQFLCGEYWRVQNLYRRDFLRLLHLGKLVLLSQQLIHRLFNLVLPVQVRVGHSQQRKSFNRRRDESLIVRRIGGIPSKLLQLLVQLIDTRSQRFHTYVAIRINLLESAQLGPRGN